MFNFFIEKYFLFYNLKLTILEKKVSKNCEFVKIDHNKKNIFFQLIPDYYYLCYYKALFNDSRFECYNKIGIWTDFLATNSKTNFFLFILKRIYQVLYYFFLKKKWIQLYKVINYSKCINLTKSDFFYKKNFQNKNKNKIKKKINLLSLKYKNILIGDLIYDTYLRFRNYPTIDFMDGFLNYLIIKSYEINSDVNRLIKKYNPKIYFTGYTTYMQNGLPTRFFLSRNIKVYSGKNYVKLNQKLTKSYFSHHPNHKNFMSLFEKLNNKKKIIQFSKKNIAMKYNTNNKNIPTYLKLNPYKQNQKLEKFFYNKLKNIKGVLFLQSFHDAPHSWGKMIFPDFYTWCVFTLNLIKKYKLPIAVKPHPNENFFVESLKMPNTIKRLKKRYKDLVWLDERLNNKYIFKFIKYGISASGSILFELALFNKIAISCGDHPGRYFNFAIEAKNQSDYKKLLTKPIKQFKKKTDLKSLYIFNYMYYLHSRSSIPIKNKYLEKFLLTQRPFKIDDLIYVCKLI